MVARRRSGTAAGLRWTLAQRLPLPVNGFTVKRFIHAAETTVVNAIRLPGAAEIAPRSWTIDDATLVQDHTSRSASPGNPTLPALAELHALRPVLLFALPYADAEELGANLIAVACMLGDSHEQDVNLRMKYWPDGPPPSRDNLAALRNGSAASERAYSDVVAHYCEQATTRLLFLSSNYPMAILLGFGFEDELPEDADHARYDLLCDWGGRNASCVADLKTKDADWPVPPTLEETIQGDGWAGYPGFARFYVAGSGWTPSAPAGDTLLKGLVAAASKGPRSCPAPTALLSWRPGPNGEPEGDEEGSAPLLGRGEVEWLIERHALGIAPSADEDPPKIDPAAFFSPCHDANPLLRNKANRFEDDVDPPWEAPVLEGWHAYRVTATDLFGISGPPSVPSLVCLRDRYAPRPPRPRLVHGGESLMLGPCANVVRLALDWDAANELSAPDATEFRVYQTWSAIEHVPLEVGETTEAAGELGSVQVDVRVLDADGRPVAAETLEKMPGGQLLTPDGEFAILGAGPGSVLRVRRSAGRAPPRRRGSRPLRHYASNW